MENINVSIEVVSDILNKLNILKEETEIYLSDVQKTIDNAELRGWNDKKYIEFRDMIDPILKNGRDMVRKIEESAIPYLKQLQAFIEEY